MSARMWGEGEPRARLWECVNGAAALGSSAEASEDIKNRATIGCSNPTAGHVSKEINQNLKEIPALPIYCSIIHGNQDMGEKKPRESMYGRMDKEDTYVHTPCDITSHEKEGNPSCHLAIWASMDGP